MNKDAKELYDELERVNNFLEIAITLLEFHGRPSIQKDNSVKMLRKQAGNSIDVLCKYEDKYWGKNNPQAK